MAKYEKARKLKDHIAQVRSKYKYSQQEVQP